MQRSLPYTTYDMAEKSFANTTVDADAIVQILSFERACDKEKFRNTHNAYNCVTPYTHAD